MGKDPRDLLSEDQIIKILEATFNKFDNDGSGKLEEPEFHEAWAFLGLKGKSREISRAFKEVDVDHSGLIEIDEFMRAIKDNVRPRKNNNDCFFAVKNWVSFKVMHCLDA